LLSQIEKNDDVFVVTDAPSFYKTLKERVIINEIDNKVMDEWMEPHFRMVKLDILKRA